MKIRSNHTSVILYLATVLVAMLMLNGCDGDKVTDSGGHGVEKVVMSLDNVEVAAGEEMEIAAYLLNADGDTVNVSNLNVEWGWWSTNDEVFTIEYEGSAAGPATGTIIGHRPGEEFCIVEATIIVGSSNFTGRDSVRVHVF